MAFFYKVNMDITGTDENTYQQGVGYSAGGRSGASSTNAITALDFATETTFTPALFITNIRRQCTGLSSPTVGLICGGYNSDTGTRVNDIDGINFTTESMLAITAVLGSSITGAGSLNGPTSGFLWSGYYGINGGTVGTASQSTTSVNYSTYSSGIYGTRAAVARGYSAGVSGTETGFGIGGDSGSLTTEIDGLTFSTITSLNPSAVLGSARTGAVGLDNTLIGFCASGSSTTVSSSGQTNVTGFNIISTTTFSVSAVFTSATTYAQGVNSTQAGYLLGGENTAASILSSIKKIGFLSQETSNVSSTLSIGQSMGAGVWTRVFHNMTGRAYTAGGYTGSANHGDVNALDFSNNSTKVINGYIGARRHHGGLSSTNTGYFVCGYTSTYISSIYKIYYSSDTIVSSAIAMTYGNANGASLANYARGYYVGGDTTSVINGLIFDTETAFNTSNSMPTANSYSGFFSNPKISYGWVFGGNSNGATMQALSLSTEVASSCINSLVVPSYGSVGVGHDTKSSAYVCGGYNAGMGGVIASILTYSPTAIPSTITTSVSANALANVRHIGSAASSTSTGYCIGGYTSWFTNTTDKVDLATATSTPLGATNTLSQLSGYCATVYTDVMFKNYNLAGFIFGGVKDDTNARQAGIDVYDFTSEACYQNSTGLSEPSTNQGAVSSVTTGYFAGGDINSGTTSAINRFVYATKVYSNTGQVLADGARANLDGVNSYIKGYWAGGRNSNSTVAYSKCDGWRFSIETYYNVTGVLSQTKYGTAAFNSSTSGYWNGGVSVTPTYLTRTDKILFSTEAITSLGNIVPVTRVNAAGTNSSTKGYYFGGQNGASVFSTIHEFTFSTETWNGTSIASLSQTKQGMKGFGNENAGYVAGGCNLAFSVSYQTIEKLVYATNTCSVRDAVLAIPKSRAAALSAI
jgi:hypothetical protein